MKYPGLTLIDHPVLRHHLTRLRQAGADPEEFRRALHQAAALMVYEATRSLRTRACGVRTPLARTRGEVLRDGIVVVPILRAGLGMLDSILQVLPHARVGFIGLQRNHQTLRAAVYHKSLPAVLGSSEIVVIDPMLATGGSAVAALRLLRKRGARKIRFVCLVAAPEGIGRLQREVPGLMIFTAAIDERLDQNGYIVPGLGDAGDRLFGV